VPAEPVADRPPWLLVRGARLVDPARNLDAEGDVLVRDGHLAAVAPGGLHDPVPEGAMVVPAEGAWLVAGTLDLFPRIGLPSAAGGRGQLGAALEAAARGGYTALAPRPDTQPPNDAPAITRLLRGEADRIGSVRLHPMGALTAGVAGARLAEAAALRDEGIVALSDGDRTVLDAGVFRRALEYARTFALPVFHRGEDPGLAAGAVAHEGPTATRLGLPASPGAAEAVVVARDLELAALTGASLVLGPLSAASSVRLVREAKARGLPLGAIATVDHLRCTDAAVDGYDVAAKRVPPFRSQGDRDALREAARDGTIDALVSGHDPPRPGREDAPFADAEGGAATLEHSLPTLFGLARGGVLSPARAVTLVTGGPGGLLAEATRRPGGLAPGATADLTLVSPASGDVASGDGRRHGGGSEGRVLLTMVEGRLVHLDPRLAKIAGDPGDPTPGDHDG